MLRSVASERVIAQRILQTRFVPFTGMVLRPSWPSRPSAIRSRDLRLAILTGKVKTAAAEQQRLTRTLWRPCSLKIRDIADVANIARTTVRNHLTRMRYANRRELSVPRLLTEIGLMKRISTCDLLLQRHERDLKQRRELDFLSKCVSKTHFIQRQ